MRKEKALTSGSLKAELWDTLQAVKAKEIDPKIANAIGTQSREIMRIIKMELTIVAMAGRKPKGRLLAGFSGE